MQELHDRTVESPSMPPAPLCRRPVARGGLGAPSLSAQLGASSAADSDQAALLALATSNMVPHQHRMLERPAGAAGGAAAGTAAAIAGTAAGGASIVLRTRIGAASGGGGTTEVVIMNPGGGDPSGEDKAVLHSSTGEVWLY